jgi:hypothetical protein
MQRTPRLVEGAEQVDVGSKRLDSLHRGEERDLAPHRSRWSELVDVDVAAAFARKQQRRAVAIPDPIERVESPCLQRHRPRARLRLRDLEFAAGEGAERILEP